MPSGATIAAASASGSAGSQTTNVDPMPGLGPHRELAALRLDELAGDGEPEAVGAALVVAAPTIALVAALPVALEHQRVLGRGDAGALVSDRHPDPALAATAAHRDRRASRCQPHRVREEVADRTPDGRSIHRGLHRVRRGHGQPDASGGRGAGVLSRQRVRFLREIGERVSYAVERQTAMRGEIVDRTPHTVDRATCRGHLRRRLSVDRRVARSQLEVGRRDREWGA